jgi:hypothetical protein
MTDSNGEAFFQLCDAGGGNGYGCMEVRDNSAGIAFTLAGTGLLDGNNNNPLLGWDGTTITLGNAGQPVVTTDNTLDDGSGNATFVTINGVSDSSLKENITNVSLADALSRVVALPLSSWNFKARTNTVTQHVGLLTTNFITGKIRYVTLTNIVTKIVPASPHHIGAMAQDWQRVTGLGTGTNINLQDEIGYCQAAIQELNAKLTNDEATIYSLTNKP